MERWRTYFESLLNQNYTPHQKPDYPTNKDTPNSQDNITHEEVVESIRKLKNGKAPGIDKITSEMIKKLGPRGNELLRKFLNMIWHQEKIPKEWEIGMLIPIYKSGDKTVCNNYRGITLIGTVTKVYESILERRIRKIVESNLSESQSGFRQGRCVHDHVHSLKTIINRALERNKTLFIAYRHGKSFRQSPTRKDLGRFEETEYRQQIDSTMPKYIPKNKNCDNSQK